MEKVCTCRAIDYKRLLLTNLGTEGYECERGKILGGEIGLQEKDSAEKMLLGDWFLYEEEKNSRK